MALSKFVLPITLTLSILSIWATDAADHHPAMAALSPSSSSSSSCKTPTIFQSLNPSKNPWELGIKAAWKLFTVMEDRDAVSWNSMMAGFLKVRQLSEARKLFDEMPGKDIVSWNNILDGSVKVGEMEIYLI
ncbi:hypothetical protein V6N13_014740 [Hibiscus sabdariffa]|uniref:Pentatricopeptide repeat-containing protein n=1 Tax=Hibiscus sabdariffa TaxID=183260 RepID=A0ABR2RWR3_9ROSI